MLCNWSTAANTILHSVVRRNAGVLTRWCEPRTFSQPTGLGWQGKPSMSSRGQLSLAFPSNSFRTNHAGAASERPPEPPSNPTSSPPSKTDFSSIPLKSSQISRAAAQAVRLSARDGKFGDALYLVNSLHFSVHRDQGRFAQHNPEMEGDAEGGGQSQMKPIDFGRPVSPRLSAHAFLHGLVREGYGKKAASYAEMMMQQGIRIRGATLNSIVSSLTPNLAKPLNGGPWSTVMRRPKVRHAAEILYLRSSLIGDPCTQAAVNLLRTARFWGQQRSERMWDNVINTCLMQGEIIVASLLIVLLVKDTAARYGSVDSTQHTDGDGDRSFIGSDNIDNPSPENARKSPSISPQRMKKVLKGIDQTLSRDLSCARDEGDAVIPLQALANFAMLLDSGQLPRRCVAQVIRSLYSCPKTNRRVWITEKEGTPTQVAAYPYFQSVIMRFIVSRCEVGGSVTYPRLNLQSYNALLHYTLRHRFSPKLASRVLEHMCIHRDPPLQPNIITYNILLRSGTLLRKNSISEAALQILRAMDVDFRQGLIPEEASTQEVADEVADEVSNKVSADISVKVLDDVSSDVSDDVSSDVSDDVSPSPASPFLATLQRLKSETLQVPDPMTWPASETQANAYTLTSSIAHLTSSGRPELVVNIVFAILPELCTIRDDPSWSSLTPRQRAWKWRKSRAVCVQRAVSRGPYVFAAILNALVKANMIQLAEKVWILAREAEAASWKRQVVPNVDPWCIPVHAYTSMLQCYASYARRSIKLLRRDPGNRDVRLDETEEYERPGLGHALGWTRFAHMVRETQRKSRKDVSDREMNTLMYKLMRSGGQTIYRSLISLRHVTDSPIPLPSPDARFFNAALDLFGHHPYMKPRTRSQSRARWRRGLQGARERYVHHGKRSQLWTPMLQEVAEDIMAAGFAVPAGYHPLFVGRQAPPSLYSDRPEQLLDCRPHEFPPVRHKFSSHAIPTIKTRGLPLRRRVHRTRNRRDV